MSLLDGVNRILCRLGRHVPEPDPVWNHGYFFSRCRTCGSDLIRTGSGPWHVPRGRKVVWRPRKPRGRRPGE